MESQQPLLPKLACGLLSNVIDGLVSVFLLLSHSFPLPTFSSPPLGVTSGEGPSLVLSIWGRNECDWKLIGLVLSPQVSKVSSRDRICLHRVWLLSYLVQLPEIWRRLTKTRRCVCYLVDCLRCICNLLGFVLKLWQHWKLIARCLGIIYRYCLTTQILGSANVFDLLGYTCWVLKILDNNVMYVISQINKGCHNKYILWILKSKFYVCVCVYIYNIVEQEAEILDSSCYFSKTYYDPTKSNLLPWKGHWLGVRSGISSCSMTCWTVWLWESYLTSLNLSVSSSVEHIGERINQIM